MKLGAPLGWMGLALLSVACKAGGGGDAPPAPGSSASAPPSVASAAASTASSSRPAHRNHRGGGLFGLLLHATRDITLTDAQHETLFALDDQLHEGDASRGSELATLDADVAAGIRAGKIDMAKVQADYAAIDAAMQANLAKEATATNGLHAALDATQRKQLVEGIRAKQNERDQRLKSLPDAGTPDLVKMRLTRMTAELNLTPDQQKQVAAVLAKTESPALAQARRDSARQRVDALLAAFPADDFDAAKLAPPSKSLHEGIAHEVDLAAQLLPILDADQRDRLAVQRERQAKLRARMGVTESPWGDEGLLEENLHRLGGVGGP